jgi:TrmH family RNA methyltransferase
MHDPKRDAQVLSRIRSLTHPYQRRSEGCYWIEGIRHFVQAYDTQQQFDAVVYSPLLLKSDLAEMLVRRLKAKHVACLRLSPEQFRTVSKAERASGIGAILKQRWESMKTAPIQQGTCWIVVEDLRCPGNMGTILRTAEATGAAGIILVGRGCDPFDPAVVRASMGGLFHLKLIRTTHADLRQWATDHGVLLVGVSPSAERLWTELPTARSYGLVFGEERSGLSGQMQSICHTSVRLPMTGKADSLNVGVAAGVMMYELIRRAQTPDGPTACSVPANPPAPRSLAHPSS